MIRHLNQQLIIFKIIIHIKVRVFFFNTTINIIFLQTAQVIPYDFQSPVVFDEIPNDNEVKGRYIYFRCLTYKCLFIFLAKIGVVNVMPGKNSYTILESHLS
jgi:hypothetical protein